MNLRQPRLLVAVLSLALLSLLCLAPVAQTAPAAGGSGSARIPPAPGVPLPAADRSRIEGELGKLTQRLKTLPKSSGADDLSADVAIYEKALRFALQDDEFYKPADTA